MPSMIDPKWRQSYEQLLQEYILDRAQSMKEQAAETQPKDRQQADVESATTVNHRDFAFAQASSYHELLREINHALRRIEEGHYGICEVTGRPIPMKRLKAIPWTRFSKEAEQKLESRGRSSVHFELPRAQGLKGAGSSDPLSTQTRKRKWRRSNFFAVRQGLLSRLQSSTCQSAPRPRTGQLVSNFVSRGNFGFRDHQILRSASGNIWLRPKV